MISSLGHREAVAPGAQLVLCDLADRSRLDHTFRREHFDAVIHMAALSVVSESMARPLHYLCKNVSNGLSLIHACVSYGIKRFVFSSTANVYSADLQGALTEDSLVAPSSPYGESKFAIERALAWAEKAHGMRSAVLRYFNAAGADPSGRLGEDHNPETHLVPLVVDAALGRREPVKIFGTDYSTPDGTCIRDYVHVTDLAHAHVAVLDRLRGSSITANVGTGRGASVRQVVDAVSEALGSPVPTQDAPRRPGDPPSLIAEARRLTEFCGWIPRYSDLETIVQTTVRWRLAHPRGYATESF